MAQVKVIVHTPTNYRPGTPPADAGKNPAPVPGTAVGKAPTKAPSQTVLETGLGPAAKGQDGHPDPPARVPPPASHGSTGPVKAGPSVDYHTQQGNRVPADIGKPGAGSDYLAEQQPAQDAAGN